MYDVDKDKELATKYSIRYVPTLVFIDNNVVVEKVSGYQSKSEILKILEKY